MEDWTLLREYLDKGSEAAFTTLVNRHLSLVYSAALRRVENPQVAEDITQNVFCLLAQKARNLDTKTVLAGWLYQTVHHLTAKHWRNEQRRRQRELEAMHANTPTPNAEASWVELAPLVDEAMAQLPEEDRVAILLRFFQDKPFIQVGISLGISENAARMRVNRALDRLRVALEARKLACTAAILGTLLLENSVSAVPKATAESVHAAWKAAEVASSAFSIGSLIALLSAPHLRIAVIACSGLTAAGLSLYLANPSKPETTLPEIQFPSHTAQKTSPLANAVIPTQASLRRPLPATAKIAQSSPASNEARELYELGWKLQKENKFSEALDAYSKSIALLEQGIGHWPAYKDVYFSRACLYADLKNYKASIADHTRRLELDPDYYSSRHNRALYYSYLGKLDEAIADYSMIIADQDIDYSTYGSPKEKAIALAYEYRGRIYEDRKEFSKALADYSNSIQTDPNGGDNMLVYWRRGKLYRETGQLNLAIIDADIMSERAMQLAATYTPNARSTKEPLMIVNKALEILKESAPYHLEAAAAVNSRYGEYDSAIRYQELAIKRATSITEEERAAMQTRLELYRSRIPLISDPTKNRRPSTIQ